MSASLSATVEVPADVETTFAAMTGEQWPEALAARAAGAGAPDITVLLEAEDVRAENVRTVVAELTEELGIEATAVLERGSPVRALLEHQEEAALIVVGTGRKGALEEFVLGTTSIGVAAPVVGSDPRGGT